MKNIIEKIEASDEVSAENLDRNLYMSKFERIYQKYNKLMYKEAYSILRNKHDIEDAVQQSCLRIFQCVEKINEEQEGMTYNFIKVITKNVAIDIYSNKIYLNSKEDEIDRVTDDVTRTRKISLDDIVIANDSAGRIIEIINKLPEKSRDILLLEKVFGYTREETMNLLGESNETLKKRMTRAKTKLLKALREEDLNEGRENIGKVVR